MTNHSQRLWNDYWHLLCHRSEVALPRAFVRFDVCGEEVVAFNDGKDVIAFNNLCPHRGTRIFDGHSGNAPFLCRYHGWSYSKGRLFVADKAQFSHCNPELFSLAQLKTEWVGDFLFISTNPAHQLDDQLEGFGEILRRISLSIDRRSDLNAYDYDCIWQIGVENALEPYHVAAIHPESLNTLQLDAGENQYSGLNSAWFTHLNNKLMRKRLASISKFFSVDYAHSGYMNIYIFPFTMLSSTFGLSYSVQHFFPSPKENSAHFVSRLYTARLRDGVKPELLADFFRSSADINRQIFLEDKEICARVPARSWSPNAPQLYARSEDRLVHFRQSYRSATAEGGVSYSV